MANSKKKKTPIVFDKFLLECPYFQKISNFHRPPTICWSTTFIFLPLPGSYLVRFNICFEDIWVGGVGGADMDDEVDKN